MTKHNEPNIIYYLHESSEQNNDISYEEILQQVNEMDDAEELSFTDDDIDVGMDDYLALELDYRTNYIKKDIDMIADYYTISKRKKRKDELIEDIVLFEKDPVNIQKTYQRKKLWRYIEEIKKDKYLRQFLILD
uniref:Uncharacterized protein n=1 Tax=viral metagenome TaxID=1070528 RepID=A0A6C0C2Y7_9ZZZZ